MKKFEDYKVAKMLIALFYLLERPKHMVEGVFGIDRFEFDDRREDFLLLEKEGYILVVENSEKVKIKFTKKTDDFLFNFPGYLNFEGAFSLFRNTYADWNQHVKDPFDGIRAAIDWVKKNSIN